MKRILVVALIALLGSYGNSLQAQCSGRYYDKIFPEPDVFANILGVPVPDVTKLSPHRVVYGNAGGTSLDMYVLQPENDQLSQRPLVVLAFGGSFTAGLKESPDIIKLCQEFTSRGFVTASIAYRLLPGSSPIDSANMLKQVIKAVQDAKAAIRFFYKDAQTTNTYRIDTNKIFMGGTSAGAFIGVHIGHVTDTVGLQQWMKDIIASQGDLEGTSGNPGYSSRVAGIINLAGAIGDSSWIKPGAVPMVSMHGDDDGTVPYCTDIINVSGNDIIEVDGSATIKSRTAHLGIRHPFYTWRGAGHVPYVDPTPTSDGPAYMDTTVWFVRDFLYEMMTGTRCPQPWNTSGRVANPCGEEIFDPTDTATATGIIQPIASGDMLVYPNPSDDAVVVEIPFDPSQVDVVQVYDQVGRLVRTASASGSKILLHKNDLGAGLFVVVVKPKSKLAQAVRAKMLIQ